MKTVLFIIAGLGILASEPLRGQSKLPLFRVATISPSFFDHADIRESLNIKISTLRVEDELENALNDAFPKNSQGRNGYLTILSIQNGSPRRIDFDILTREKRPIVRSKEAFRKQGFITTQISNPNQLLRDDIIHLKTISTDTLIIFDALTLTIEKDNKKKFSNEILLSNGKESWIGETKMYATYSTGRKVDFETTLFSKDHTESRLGSYGLSIIVTNDSVSKQTVSIDKAIIRFPVKFASYEVERELYRLTMSLKEISNLTKKQYTDILTEYLRDFHGEPFQSQVQMEVDKFLQPPMPATTSKKN